MNWQPFVLVDSMTNAQARSGFKISIVLISLTVLLLTGGVWNESENAVSFVVQRDIDQFAGKHKEDSVRLVDLTTRAETAMESYAAMLGSSIRDKAISQKQHAELLRSRSVEMPDGSLRLKRDKFDSQTQAGTFMPSFAERSIEQLATLDATASVVSYFGASSSRLGMLADAWFLTPEGSFNMYWAEYPEFHYSTPHDYNYAETEFFEGCKPTVNPQRRASWTNVLYDLSANTYMVSLIHPVYDGDRLAGCAGFDIPVAWFDRIIISMSWHQAEYYYLVTDDGRVLASNIQTPDGVKPGELNVSSLEISRRQAVSAAVDAAKRNWSAPALDGETEDGLSHWYVSYMPNQRWFLVNVLPLQSTHSSMNAAFSSLRALTMLSLMMGFCFAVFLIYRTTKKIDQERALREESDSAAMESQASLHRMLTSIPDPVCVASYSLGKLSESRLVGGSNELIAQVLQANGDRPLLDNLVFDDDKALRKSAIKAAILANKSSYVVDYRIVNPNRMLRYVSEHGAIIPSGLNEFDIYANLRDVTAAFRVKEISDDSREKVKFRNDIDFVASFCSFCMMITPESHPYHYPKAKRVLAEAHLFYKDPELELCSVAELIESIPKIENIDFISVAHGLSDIMVSKDFGLMLIEQVFDYVKLKLANGMSLTIALSVRDLDDKAELSFRCVRIGDTTHEDFDLHDLSYSVKEEFIVALTRFVMLLIGGKVWVTSEPGATTFSVLFTKR